MLATKINFSQFKVIVKEHHDHEAWCSFFNHNKLMKQKFVKLTDDILKLAELTSTEKILLSFNRGHPRYFASHEYAAERLGMTVSLVKKSVTKLRKLGLWRASAGYSGSKATATRVTDADTRVARSVTRVADKKSFPPLKTGSGLESRLESNKKEGLESAAGAAALCDSPQTSFKILEKEDSVSLKSQEIKISAPTGSEAPIEDRHPSVAPTVPLGADGKPLTAGEMLAANFEAMMAGLPDPYTLAQYEAATKNGTCARAHTEDLLRLFGNGAG